MDYLYNARTRYSPHFFRSSIVLCILLICIAAAGYSQGTNDSPPPSDSKSASSIRISQVDFEVHGRTLKFLLLNLLEKNGALVGKTFSDTTQFEAYLAGCIQTLLNNRVLSDAKVSYNLTTSAENAEDAAVLFSVTDTWNIIALPQPQYSSNTGLTFYIKGKDYNAFGSMQPMTLNLSYISDTADLKSFDIYTTFTLPFLIGASEWAFILEQDSQIWTNGQYRNVSSAGITYYLPGKEYPASITLTQSYNYNYEYPDEVLDTSYFGNSLNFTVGIPLGNLAAPFGTVTYSPSITAKKKWWPNAYLNAPGRNDLELDFGNALGTGQINWIGNMREGMSLSLSSTPAFGLFENTLSWQTSMQYQYFHTWLSNRLGIAVQVTGIAQTLGKLPELGSYLRGVIDARLTAAGGVFVNFGLPISIATFPIHSLITTDFLDFEMQVQPFFDAGLAIPQWGNPPSTRWAQLSGGLELLFFPMRMRSLIFRASLGWDIMGVLRSKSITGKIDGYSPYEIFIGTGLSY